MKLTLIAFAPLLSLITPAAHADPGTESVSQAAPKIEMIGVARQFVAIQWDWSESPLISLVLIGDHLNPLHRINGTKQSDGTWKFLVPDSIIATFQEVIINPADHSVVGVITNFGAIKDARVTLAADKANETSGLGSIGDVRWINIESVISCSGDGCAQLIDTE